MTRSDNKLTAETITWAHLQTVAALALSEEALGDFAFATPRELANYAAGGLLGAKQRCVEILNALDVKNPRLSGSHPRSLK